MKRSEYASRPAPGFERLIAAAYCGVSMRLLDQWRAEGTGPQYFFIGCQPRYWPAALDRYINLDPKLMKKASLARKGCPYTFDARL